MREFMKKNKPYIVVAQDRFELNCDGWTLFLALKTLFNQIKTDTNYHALLCKKLVDCDAFVSGLNKTKEMSSL